MGEGLAFTLTKNTNLEHRTGLGIYGRNYYPNDPQIVTPTLATLK